MPLAEAFEVVRSRTDVSSHAVLDMEFVSFLQAITDCFFAFLALWSQPLRVHSLLNNKLATDKVDG